MTTLRLFLRAGMVVFVLHKMEMLRMSVTVGVGALLMLIFNQVYAASASARP